MRIPFDDHEGGFVQVRDGSDRRALADVTAEAATQLWKDSAFRREAASWSRANTTRQRDGVPGYAVGEGAVLSWVQPALSRAGRPIAMPEELVRLIEGSPVVLVIGSKDDSRASLLRAGEGMQRLLLRAAALHVPELRAAVARLSAAPAVQVVLRLGTATRCDRPLGGGCPRCSTWNYVARVMIGQLR